jgi:hypothetical protein
MEWKRRRNMSLKEVKGGTNWEAPKMQGEENEGNKRGKGICWTTHFPKAIFIGPSFLAN